ncbi:MAG: hypothetical protein PSV23_16310 [Brevundimonas sp.]|uniref:hypothetical protein n=1 Tax=Brevundimonas sp. TaxID=1871086 RepID=UPI002489A06C|nr:hypothetical protein [Brevundimonas sp.]MDI1328355.1 hypothetical protein [Brevundimonas sp.]
MTAPDNDPSGYQRLIVKDQKQTHRWLLVILSLAIVALMLFFERWRVYLWSGVLLLQLAFRLAKRYFAERTWGYDEISQRDRFAVAETVVALVLITAFVVVQSRLGLWFSQNEFNPRYGQWGQYG